MTARGFQHAIVLSTSWRATEEVLAAFIVSCTACTTQLVVSIKRHNYDSRSPMGREMSEADQRWGARLKQARLNAGLSQKMLGIEAGIDAFVASTRINRYELGIHRPDLLTVRKLAKVLDVPVAFFFADEDDEIAELLLLYKKAGTPVRAEILKMLACL